MCPRRPALGKHRGRQRRDLAAVLRELDAPMLRGTVGLDQADVEVEFALRDRRAIVDGDRQRIAGALRMLDQRPQDGRSGAAAERADKGEIVRAGAPLPAAVAGHDAGRFIEKVRSLGEHAISLLLVIASEAKQSISFARG